MKKVKLLLLLILLVSCIQSGLNQVRIVDSNGNPAKINKIVPSFNEQQMMKQKEAFNNSITEVNKFRQDFNEINQNQEMNIETHNDSNVIKVANSNKYPEDIFADRITNYKYLDTNKNVQIIDKSTTSNTQNTNKNNTNKIVETKVEKNNQTVNTKNNQEINVKNNTNKTTNSTKGNNIPKTKNDNTKKVTSTNNINSKGFYIQIGIFNKKTNAENSYKQFSSIHKGGIDEYISNSKVKYKVLLGPYSNRNTAEKDLEKVIKTGHYDVYITEKK